VSDRSKACTLALLVSFSAFALGESVAADVKREPCDDEWRQMLQSSADPQEKIRVWTALGMKCAGSGLYETRMALLYIFAGRYGDARTTAQGGLALGTPHEKDLLSVLANVDLSEGKLERALLDYESLIKKYPDYYDGYSGVGAVKLLQHQLEESIHYLNEAAKRARTMDTYRNLTLAYYGLERYQEAVTAINEAYALDKGIVKDRESMHAAARAYIYLGKLHAADGFLKMLLQANPEAANDPETRKTIDYVSKKLAQEKSKDSKS
jgi:tetratricopeptide (TPR) repeat protein